MKQVSQFNDPIKKKEDKYESQNERQSWREHPEKMAPGQLIRN
jgi:hypothetical protein